MEYANILHDSIRIRLGQSICSINEKQLYLIDIQNHMLEYFNECINLYELQYKSLEKKHFINEIKNIFFSNFIS